MVAEALGQSPAQVDAVLEAALWTQLLRPGRVLYRDDFTDPESGWATRSSAPAKWEAGYEDGECAVVQNAGCGCSPVSTGPMQLGDFLAEIDARLTPPTENTYLMLDFRVQRDGGRYRFRVDLNGPRFSLRRWPGTTPRT